MKVNCWDKCFLCLTNLGTTLSSSLSCGGSVEKKARGKGSQKRNQNKRKINRNQKPKPITNRNIFIKYLLGAWRDEMESDSLFHRILQLIEQPTSSISSSGRVQIQFCDKCQDSAGRISDLHRELEVIQMKIVEILGSLRKTVISNSTLGTGNNTISRMGFEQEILDTRHAFQAAVFEKSKQSAHIPLIYIEKFTGSNQLTKLWNRALDGGQEVDHFNLIKTEPVEADEFITDFGGDDSLDYATITDEFKKDGDHHHGPHETKMDIDVDENSSEVDGHLLNPITIIKEENSGDLDLYPIYGRRKSAQTAAQRIADVKNLSRPRFQYLSKKVGNKPKRNQKLERKSSPPRSQDPTKIFLNPVLKSWVKKPDGRRKKSKSSSKAASTTKQIRKKFECELCPFKTKTTFQFEHHLREHESPEVVNHTCPHCKDPVRQFSQQQSLDYHMKSHAGFNKMTCDICTQLVRPFGILEHLRGHTGIEKIFQCSGCSYFCGTRDSYLRHTRLHKTAALVCDVCSKEFRIRQKLLHHMHDEHKLLEKIKCPVENCDKEFFETPTLILHKKLHMEAFVCLQCDLQFSSKHLLNIHEIRKHSREKPHSCPDCPEAFIRKPDLQRHAIIVHGAAKLKCPYCPKEYSDQTYLSMHMNVHEGNSFSCDKCPKVFGTRGRLKRHQEWHNTTKDFICEECGKAFTNTISLSSHMKIHVADKKYKCGYCPKAFVTKDHCVRHERIHTGEKPYVCEACGKDFIQNVSLKQHMKTHHNETI